MQILVWMDVNVGNFNQLSQQVFSYFHNYGKIFGNFKSTFP